MKVVPLNDKVVIKRLDAEEITAGGIVLPDSGARETAAGTRFIGRRRAIAFFRQSRPAPGSEGDRVLFQRWAGAEVGINGQNLLILSEDEIPAIVK